MILNRDLFRGELIELENGIYEPKGLQKGDYDTHAIQYDKLISNAIYNKIMWGNTPKDYASFCKKGIENRTGLIADIGCGTLGFTHKTYTENTIRNLFLCDLSLEMLKIGKEKITSMADDISTITFLRSDALNMPFKDSLIQTVLSFGIFHVFENPSKLVEEMVRILKPDGRLFLSSLCTDRKLSAKYLNFLHKKGHVAKPLSSSEIVEIVENNGIEISEKKIKGGVIYLTGKRRTKENK